jgi:hypothetical protein
LLNLIDYLASRWSGDLELGGGSLRVARGFGNSPRHFNRILVPRNVCGERMLRKLGRSRSMSSK